MTVYADVLVGLNILVTYITIVAARLILKLPTNKYSVLAASLVGGFSALIIFFEGAGAFFASVYKLITAAVIVAVAFLPKKIKAFIKCYAAFFLITFLFGGAMLGLSLASPESIIYFNGTVYFNMSLSYLTGCVLSVYGIFTAANYLIEKRVYKNELCRVRIELRENSIELTGFIDSGNNLFDFASGRSVIIAEYSALKPLFSFEEREFLKKSDYESIPRGLYKRMRLIPSKTVVSEGMLTAILPDRVDVFWGGKVFRNVYCVVGISLNDLSNGEYSVILNKHIFDGEEEEILNENKV